MCQLRLSQLNCSAFKANELCSDYKGLNYSIHRLWIMQRFRCHHFGAHRMGNVTQVLNTAHGRCRLVWLTGLNSLPTCLHMRARTWVFLPRWRHGAHAKCDNWEETWRRACLPSGTCLRFIRRKRAKGFRSICWWKQEWSGVRRRHARQSWLRLEQDDCHCT